MDLQSLGRTLFFLGIAITLSGGAIMLLGRVFPSSGGMAGDIRIQTRNLSCFAPIGSMIVLSVILTIVLNIVLRLLNR